MSHFSKHLNILVMPTDACNMNCVYCFHKPYHADIDKMSIATVKRMLDITTPYYKSINLIWHGGEPLIMGLDFYKGVIELENKYHCRFKNSIQSNLTLLSEEMAKFFADNNFAVSTSFDGCCNHLTRGNDEKIMAGRNLIVDNGRRCGIIMVVSKLNIGKLIDSYLYFKSINSNFSLNLYLDQKDNSKDPLRLEKVETVNKINALFDYWLYDKTGNITIRYFMDILNFILFKKKSLCTYTSCLGRWMGVRHDGEITPCNRMFPIEYSYGNIFDYDDIGAAFESSGFKLLIQDAIARREKCKVCKIYDFCNGGCNNVALNENGIRNNGGLSCQILLDVYEHIDSVILKQDLRNADINKFNPMFLKMLKKY